MSSSPPLLFDRSTVLRHRARAARMAGDRFLAHEAAEGIADRLAAVNRPFQRGLSVDGREKLNARITDWTDINLEDSDALSVERESFDLAVSVLSLHAVNDLPGVLTQIRRALKPDGLFLGALFAGETLFELRDSFAAAEFEITGGVSPRVAPFADVRDLGSLLQRAGFALPVADVERTTVLYRKFGSLTRDLRVHGETNALHERNRNPLSRATLAAMLAHYSAHHAEPDGRLRATFDIVYLTGWAPHESQPQPLKPGSARSRLADALGAVEQPAGEKVRHD